jgi:hypothetical protein
VSRRNGGGLMTMLSFAGFLTNGPRPLFGDARAPRHDAAPSQTA